MIYRLQ
jgi:hypothetical protein